MLADNSDLLVEEVETENMMQLVLQIHDNLHIVPRRFIEQDKRKFFYRNRNRGRVIK